ncbi:hypothetical protein ACFQDF_07770 [Ectobacillus funiculus]
MERGKISKRQLFILMLLFELGSSIVINLGMQANKMPGWPFFLAQEREYACSSFMITYIINMKGCL